MYKLRFGKKRIIINSKGIELKVEDTVESGIAAKETDNSTKKLESVMDQVEEIKPRQGGGFSVEIDVEDIFSLENVFKLA